MNAKTTVVESYYGPDWIFIWLFLGIHSWPGK